MSETISPWQESQRRAEEAEAEAIPLIAEILGKIAAVMGTKDLYDAHGVLTKAGFRALEQLQQQE